MIFLKAGTEAKLFVEYGRLQRRGTRHKEGNEALGIADRQRQSIVGGQPWE